MNAFSQGIQYGEDWNESNVAAALREAVESLNIEPCPEKELSAEKIYFIQGQNWTKNALLRLAKELDEMAKDT